MANSKLLKEAIADAKAVRETAIANAKIALEEAFTPRLQSILSRKLQAEMEGEDEETMEEEMHSMDLDMDDDDQTAMEGDYVDEEEEMEMDSDESMEENDGVGYDDPTNADDASIDEEDEMGDEDELDLESIIRELEMGMDSDEEEVTEEDEMGDESDDEMEMEMEPAMDDQDMEMDDEIDLEEILREMGYGDDDADEMNEEEEEDDNSAEMEAELEEAYSVIKQLQSTINEVNLLNAKLLYANKLFRGYNLTNEQKGKVVENLDRTTTVREVKLVFATLSESMNFSGTERKGKRAIAESVASRPIRSTAPKKEIISESTNEMAARFKELANIK
jgi:exonuclease VII large subunit